MEVKKDTVDEVAATIIGLGDGTRLNVLFPLHGIAAAEPKTKTRGKKKSCGSGSISDSLKIRLTDLRQRGFNRLYQHGQIFEFSTPESLLDVTFTEPVFLLVDRIVVAADARARIVDAIESGYPGIGRSYFRDRSMPDDVAPSRRLRFSQRFECKNDHTKYDEPEPRLFSFNNPYGACPRCQGFGNTIDFDMNLVIPDPSKSLNQGAIEPWTKPKGKPSIAELRRFARQTDIPLDVPWSDLTAEQQRLVVDGDGKFEGIRGFFNYLERKKYKLHVRVFLSRYRGYSLCSACNGTRLRVEARQVKINGKNICEVSAMTVEQAEQFFANLNLSAQEAGIAERLLQEILERLRFLNEVGLEYLTLDRLSATLSGGEAQRIQLATSLGSRSGGNALRSR